jgi:hypothetical protein
MPIKTEIPPKEMENRDSAISASVDSTHAAHGGSYPSARSDDHPTKTLVILQFA